MAGSQIEGLLHEIREGLTDRLDAISNRLDAALQNQSVLRETVSHIATRQEEVIAHLGRINGQLLTHAEKIEMLQAFREKHPLDCAMRERLEAVEDFVKAQTAKKSVWKSQFTYLWAVLLVILGGIMGPIGQHFKEAWFPSGSQTTTTTTQTNTQTDSKRR